MRLRALRPSQGKCFAWWPVWTPEGKVWLEWVHFKWVEGWGWGSDGHYAYQRFVPQERYDQGERAQAINEAIYFSEQLHGVKAKHLGDLPKDVQERLLSGAKAYAGLGHPDRYQTPPGDPATFCRNFNPDGPTPCHWPHCRWHDETGDEWCGGGDRG